MDPGTNNDCLGCRIVSGTGLLGASAYILFQSKSNTNKWGRLAMNIMSIGIYMCKRNTFYQEIMYEHSNFFYSGFAAVGTARLLNVYPFNMTHKSIQNEKTR